MATLDEMIGYNLSLDNAHGAAVFSPVKDAILSLAVTRSTGILLESGTEKVNKILILNHNVLSPPS